MSDLNELKAVSRALLYVPVELCEFSPAIVIHPYTSNGLVYIGGDINNGFVDITTEDGFDKYCEKMEDIIDRAKTPAELMMLLREQYAMTWLKYSRDYLSEDEFSSLLGEAWVNCENANMDKNVPIRESVKWFREARKDKLMTEEELEVYNNLPDELTLYRGVANGRVEKGMSWTNNREKAEWFKNRFGEGGYLLVMHVRKKDVLAYFSRRDEDEYLVYPGKFEKVM